MLSKKWIQSVFCFFLLFVSCEVSSKKLSDRRLWMLEKEKVKVLSSTEQVSFLIRAIGGDSVVLYTLIPSLADPHTYQMVKGDDELFDVADVVFFSGLGLEGNGSFLRFKQRPKVVCVGDAIAKKHPEQILFVDSIPDPHLWMDASLWGEGVDAVVDALSALRPELRKTFLERAATLKKSVLGLHKEIARQMQSIAAKKRYLLTTHDAFRYFARAYMASDEERKNGSWQERIASPEGLAPDSQISTQELRILVNYCLEKQISALFPEVGINQDALYKLQEALRKEKYEVCIVKSPLFTDSLGAKGSYDAMMLYNTKIIEKALQGTEGE